LGNNQDYFQLHRFIGRGNTAKRFRGYFFDLHCTNFLPYFHSD